MMIKVIFAVCFLLCVQPSFQQEEKVTVSIYYETLCGDCVRFVVNQLHAAYARIGTSLNLDWIPYGKATHTLVNGKWQFTCQNGPQECYGNKMHACVIAETSDQKKIENFQHCTFKTYNAASETNIKNCAVAEGISWNNVLACGSNGNGDNLLATYGDRTHAVTPKITFIPTIIFNGKYDAVLQNGAMVNFLTTACGLFKVKPSGCP